MSANSISKKKGGQSGIKSTKCSLLADKTNSLNKVPKTEIESEETTIALKFVKEAQED